MVRPVELQHHSLPGLRGKIADFVEHKYFITVISVLIIVNAFTLGLETNANLMSSYGAAFHFLITSLLLFSRSRLRSSSMLTACRFSRLVGISSIS